MPVPPRTPPPSVQATTASTGASVSAARMLTFRACSFRAAGEQRCHAGCRPAAMARQRRYRSAPSVRQSRPAFPRYPGPGGRRPAREGGAGGVRVGAERAAIRARVPAISGPGQEQGALVDRGSRRECRVGPRRPAAMQMPSASCEPGGHHGHGVEHCARRGARSDAGVDELCHGTVPPGGCEVAARKPSLGLAGAQPTATPSSRSDERVGSVRCLRGIGDGRRCTRDATCGTCDGGAGRAPAGGGPERA